VERFLLSPNVCHFLGSAFHLLKGEHAAVVLRVVERACTLLRASYDRGVDGQPNAYVGPSTEDAVWAGFVELFVQLANPPRVPTDEEQEIRSPLPVELFGDDLALAHFARLLLPVAAPRSACASLVRALMRSPTFEAVQFLELVVFAAGSPTEFAKLRRLSTATSLVRKYLPSGLSPLSPRWASALARTVLEAIPVRKSWACAIGDTLRASASSFVADALSTAFATEKLCLLGRIATHPLVLAGVETQPVSDPAIFQQGVERSLRSIVESLFSKVPGDAASDWAEEHEAKVVRSLHCLYDVFPAGEVTNTISGELRRLRHDVADRLTWKLAALDSIAAAGFGVNFRCVFTVNESFQGSDCRLRDVVAFVCLRNKDLVERVRIPRCYFVPGGVYDVLSVVSPIPLTLYDS